MKLKDNVIPKSDFQYSVNIDYDLNSEEKIKGYIPTTGGLNIIEDVMLSVIPTSRDRAKLLVGAYGKGKSHLVLTILALLNKKDRSLFDKHDEVNYAVTSSELKIDTEERKVVLNLKIDTKICPVIDYFEIFMERTKMSKRAAKYLGLWFELVINDTNLL